MNELTSQAIAPAMIASTAMPTGPRRWRNGGRSEVVGAVSTIVSSLCDGGAGGFTLATLATGIGGAGFTGMAAGGFTGIATGGVSAGAGTAPLAGRSSGAGRAGRGVAAGSAAAGFGSGGRGGIWALGRRTAGDAAANGRSASIASWQLA